MKALLIGEGGMLGRAWKELLARDGHTCIAVDLPEFDLTKDASMSQVDGSFDVVIGCAAYTAVDDAEEHEELATAVNGEGIRRLAARCADVGVPLIHYGTDYVFAGDAESPYIIDTPLAPVNAYGRSKAVGENALAASGAEYLHLRTSWLYAPWAQNFVLTMARLTKERDALTVVSDQRGRPTSAVRLAETSLKLFEGGARGIYHATDGGDCTWFEFASFINEHRGNGCDIQPCGSDAFPRPAKRPAYSVLDLSATEDLIGPMLPWRQSVAEALDAVQSSRSPQDA